MSLKKRDALLWVYFSQHERVEQPLHASLSALGLPLPRLSPRSVFTTPSVRGRHVEAWVQVICVRFFISDAFDWTAASMWPFDRSCHSNLGFLIVSDVFPSTELFALLVSVVGKNHMPACRSTDMMWAKYSLEAICTLNSNFVPEFQESF